MTAMGYELAQAPGAEQAEQDPHKFAMRRNVFFHLANFAWLPVAYEFRDFNLECGRNLVRSSMRLCISLTRLCTSSIFRRIRFSTSVIAAHLLVNNLNVRLGVPAPT